MFLIKSNIIRLHGAAESLQGGRPDNQDDIGFADTPLGFLLIVCDGMGGGPGGKIASYIAKYVIANTLNECSPQMPRHKAFKMAVSKANDALEEKMKQAPNLKGMGSTFVAVLINNHSAMVAHAGDSRCYQLRGRFVLFRTKDHSLVGELVRKKALSEEQARTSPQSNVIMRGLGSVSNNVPEICEIPYRKGDRFILCTDGVWGTLPHKDLVKRFAAKADCQQVVGNLSAEIDNIGKAKGGHYDNHTIAVIEMGCNSAMKDKWLLIQIGVLAIISVIIIVCLAMALSKNHNDSSTYIRMNENIYPNIKSPEKQQIGTYESFTDVDSLKRALDSLPPKVRTEESDSTNKSDTKKANSPSKAIETSQKIINRLDSLKAYKDKSFEKAISTKASYLNQVKSLLNELCNSDIPAKSKDKASSVLKRVSDKGCFNTMLLVGMHKGTYQSMPKAIETVDMIKKEVEEINKELKNGNGNN